MVVVILSYNRAVAYLLELPESVYEMIVVLG